MMSARHLERKFLSKSMEMSLNVRNLFLLPEKPELKKKSNIHLEARILLIVLTEQNTAIA